MMESGKYDYHYTTIRVLERGGVAFHRGICFPQRSGGIRSDLVSSVNQVKRLLIENPRPVS